MLHCKRLSITEQEEIVTETTFCLSRCCLYPEYQSYDLPRANRIQKLERMGPLNDLLDDLGSEVGLRRGKIWPCGQGRRKGHPPVVIAKAWPPVGRPQQCLHCASQVHKHVTHQEKPAMQRYRGETEAGGAERETGTRRRNRTLRGIEVGRRRGKGWTCVKVHLHSQGQASVTTAELGVVKVAGDGGDLGRGSRGQQVGSRPGTYMERMGATSSREAMRIPISQMQAVSSSAQVGSPLALPWPKT